MAKYFDFIANALGEASDIAMRHFGHVVGITKDTDTNQVLTDADLEIGRFLIDKLGQTFPSHNIIDEEAGVIDKGSTHTWVVDPIDGTSNFAEGVPTFGIMLGLLEGDSPVAGGFACAGIRTEWTESN